MALLTRSQLRAPVSLGSAPPHLRPVRRVLARAEPPSGAKVTREYREDTGEVTGPSASQRADGLYVDDSAPRPVPKQGNLSKEMKARLRKEYTGLGGAENKDGALLAAATRFGRAPLLVAAASVETMTREEAAAAAASGSAAFTERPAGATQLGAEASTSAAAAAAAPAASSRPAGSKFVVDENEELRATPEMRAWVWVAIAMLGATFGEAVNQVHGVDDAVVCGASVFLAYVLADLGTGIYHWGVDNYGDGSTPVFGRQIAAFQGHHQRPWTITQREFANNLWQVFKPASFPAAGLLAVAPLMPLAWNSWSSSFLFLVCMSQQFHAWSHMKKSELPAAVVALQDAGVLIGRREHGAHHRAPFADNYAIVSGWWNPILDRSGFFKKMENTIFDFIGVEPRSWHEPNSEWRELEQPGKAASS